jgi:diaminohydroxyphosphoribosylaminopyrimidine deaminase/5-amino-6-(5-phosphoribosylamino)uracil reductase
MDIHEQIMQRCLQLAALGAGKVAPNPMVGAVLLHDNTIIGEGYHEEYGKAHAEVNCIRNVSEEKRELISSSTLYVSLEPCSHYGKTPPCADLIITQRIPRVVIGCTDTSAKVSGKGIAKLRDAGIEVVYGVSEAACINLNRNFFTFHEKKRPRIILKWAQSADGFMALPGPKPVKLSNRYTDHLVHRWRMEEQAVLIGANTALYDNPRLTNRLWEGRSPVRIIVDRNLRLPAHLHIFDHEVSTLIFNVIKEEKKGKTEWLCIPPPQPFLTGLLQELHRRDILSVIVEGGAAVLQSFIDMGLWDEARVIVADKLLGGGLPVPVLKEYILTDTSDVEGDRIRFFNKIA